MIRTTRGLSVRGALAAAFLFFSEFSPLSAEVLPEGRFRVHQTFGLVAYSSFWAGDTAQFIGGSQGPSGAGLFATPNGSGGFEEASGGVTTLLSKTTAAVGIPWGLQLSAQVIYMHASLAGNVANRQDGDVESGVAEIGFHLTKALVTPDEAAGDRFSLTALVGVRTPGNAPATGNDFLALNDGSTKYDVGLTAGLRFGDVAIQSENVFTARADTYLFPQLRSTLSVPLSFLRGLHFGPFATYFTTFGGMDIGDAAFERIAQQTGAPPFAEVREEFISLGGFLAIPLSEALVIDASLQKKIYGRNTDTSLGAGLGLGYNF